MKTRQGFVSNSSSSSFVVIGNSGKKQYPKLKEGNVVDFSQEKFGFGWGPATLYRAEDRLAFAMLQILTLANEWNDKEKKCIPDFSQPPVKGWKKMLEEVLREECNVTHINWEQHKYSYIDHQSSASEGRNTKIFKDKKTLCQFLFDAASQIDLDNDNH